MFEFIRNAAKGIVPEFYIEICDKRPPVYAYFSAEIRSGDSKHMVKLSYYVHFLKCMLGPPFHEMMLLVTDTSRMVQIPFRTYNGIGYKIPSLLQKNDGKSAPQEGGFGSYWKH